MSLVATTRKLGISFFEYVRDRISEAGKIPEGKVRQNWTTFSSPGFGIANFSFLAGKTSYLLITKLGLLTIKMLVLPRLSNFVQFHWTPPLATIIREKSFLNPFGWSWQPE
jgi:hypothetical protein